MVGNLLKLARLELWIAPASFLQHNWGIIEKVNDEYTVIFFTELGQVFDTLIFESISEAEEGLKRNYFERWNDCMQEGFVEEPELPLYELPNNAPSNQGCYSSGKHWIKKDKNAGGAEDAIKGLLRGESIGKSEYWAEFMEIKGDVFRFDTRVY